MKLASSEFVRDLILKKKRLDNRDLLDYRKIELETNQIKKAEGSCYVSIGNTKIIVGIKFDLMEPYPDTPDEGGLVTTLHYTPIVFKNMPQNSDIEISRVLDRNIRESKCIDFKELCIIEKEKAFGLFIDTYVLNNDGNLLDALNIGAIKALESTKIPKYEDGKMVYSNRKLNLKEKPVLITVSEIAKNFLVDLTSIEEKAVDYSISIGYLNKDTICAMQKWGIVGLPVHKLDQIYEIGAKKQEELRKLLNSN